MRAAFEEEKQYKLQQKHWAVDFYLGEKAPKNANGEKEMQVFFLICSLLLCQQHELQPLGVWVPQDRF